MLAVRNNKNVNVYGGPRSGLGTRLRNLSAVNINSVTKSKAKKVMFSLLYSVVLLAIIVHLISVTTSDDTGVFRQYVTSLARVCVSSLNAAIKIAETMKNVPQAVINVGTGVMSSAIGNISTLRRPRVKKALMTGALAGAAMSVIPVRGTALAALTRIRNTVTPSKRMGYIMKVANSTPGRAVMTWAGLKTSKHYFSELADMLTRYIISFSASYGISVFQSIREFKKFKNLPNNLKRASLLTENERLRIAGGVFNVIRRQTIKNNNMNNRNAARVLLSLSAGNTR
jgi:hypothetical protein